MLSGELAAGAFMTSQAYSSGTKKLVWRQCQDTELHAIVGVGQKE